MYFEQFDDTSSAGEAPRAEKGAQQKLSILS